MNFFSKAAKIAVIALLLAIVVMAIVVVIKFTFAAVVFFMPTAWLVTQVFVTVLLQLLVLEAVRG